MSDTENWSHDWNSSKNPSKQRKYRENAPLHVKGKLVSVNVNQNIREELETRNLNLRTGDRVEVTRGDRKGAKGIVKRIDREETKVYVNGIEVERNDGAKEEIPLRPSNLQIQGLNLEDPSRIEKYETEEYEDLRVSEEEVEEALEEDEEDEMMQQMQGGESGAHEQFEEDEEEEETSETEVEDDTEEPEDEETEEAEDSEDKETDYQEIVSGTITDAKDAIGELETPDYQELLEAEKENKDRKTFKQWLENQQS